MKKTIITGIIASLALAGIAYAATIGETVTGGNLNNILFVGQGEQSSGVLSQSNDLTFDPSLGALTVSHLGAPSIIASPTDVKLGDSTYSNGVTAVSLDLDSSIGSIIARVDSGAGWGFFVKDQYNQSIFQAMPNGWSFLGDTYGTFNHTFLGVDDSAQVITLNSDAGLYELPHIHSYATSMAAILGLGHHMLYRNTIVGALDVTP
jgi:hypothetical protein